MTERVRKTDSRLTRRAFLTTLTGLGGAYAVSKLVGDSGGSSSRRAQDKPLAQSEIRIDPITRTLTRSGVSILLNSDGLPQRASLPDGEIKYFFNADTLRLREMAIRSGEPEIIEVFKLPEGTVPLRQPENNEKVTDKKPRTFELPRDVIPMGELARRGVEIIQAKTTQLYIREGAFDKAEPLAGFNNTGRKLTITLLDTPVVSQAGLSEPRYEKVKHKLNGPLMEHASVINQYKQTELHITKNALELAREEIQKKQDNNIIDPTTGLTNMENLMLLCKQQPFLMNLMDDKDMLALMVSRDYFTSQLIGLYMTPTDQNNALIFLAVGDTRPDFDVMTAYFTPRGEFRVEDYSGAELAGRHLSPAAPKRFNTHPSPGDFVLNRAATPARIRSYPYGAQAIGHSLRHELWHDKLIMQSDGKPNYSEYATDINAMDGIDEAWNKWVNSGYKDNSGYHFVFSISENEYILTKSKSPVQSSANNLIS